MLDRVMQAIWASKKKVPKLPGHIALHCADFSLAELNSPGEAQYASRFRKLHELAAAQLEHGPKMLTVYLLPTNIKESPNFSTIVGAATKFFIELGRDKKLEGLNVAVLGRWYDLPPKLSAAIKGLAERAQPSQVKATLNLCVNYDGQEEIVSACKLLGKRIAQGRLDPEMLTKEAIKESIYSAKLPPPELIIVLNGKKALEGFLLWDCPAAKIYFSEKKWDEFSFNDLLKAVAQAERWSAPKKL